MSKKISDFFVKKPELNTMTGETVVKDVWGLHFQINKSVEEKFLNNFLSIGGSFLYFQKDGSDKLILNINMFYFSKDKSAHGLLKKITFHFIPDNNESFILKNGSNFNSESWDMTFDYKHFENIYFEINLSDFLKLVNANHIKWEILGIDEGEFDYMRLMNIKGVYHSIFDSEYETEALERFVEKRQADLKEYNEKKEKEKKIDNKKKQPVIQNPSRPNVLMENQSSGKKSSSNIWLIVLLVVGFLMWKRCNNISKERDKERAERLSGSNDTAVDVNRPRALNDDNDNQDYVALTEPGNYRIDYRLTTPVTVYKDVLKSKKSRFQFKPMQSVNIIKVENGLGYFEAYINYESQKGWIEMSKLVKLQPLYMESIGKRYRVKSSEIDGIQVYKDFQRKKPYARKLEPMAEFEVLYVIDNMGCNVDEILEFKVQWIEMDKLEKEEQ